MRNACITKQAPTASGSVVTFHMQYQRAADNQPLNIHMFTHTHTQLLHMHSPLQIISQSIVPARAAADEVVRKGKSGRHLIAALAMPSKTKLAWSIDSRGCCSRQRGCCSRGCCGRATVPLLPWYFYRTQLLSAVLCCLCAGQVLLASGLLGLATELQEAATSFVCICGHHRTAGPSCIFTVAI